MRLLVDPAGLGWLGELVTHRRIVGGGLLEGPGRVRLRGDRNEALAALRDREYVKRVGVLLLRERLAQGHVEEPVVEAGLPQELDGARQRHLGRVREAAILKEGRGDAVDLPEVARRRPVVDERRV